VQPSLPASVPAASRPRRHDAPGAQSAKVRIGAPFGDSFGVPFYAKDAGAFARGCFDVEVSNLANSGAVAAAVVGGSLDLGVIEFVSSTNAILHALPIQLIAGC
jgi:ABC-type nitrate/sulfonate/bicarbonate transport system substrate-binding protein